MQRLACRVPSVALDEWKRVRQNKWRRDHPETMSAFYHRRYLRRMARMSEEEKQAMRAKKAEKIRMARRDWSPERKAKASAEGKEYRAKNPEKMRKLWSDWKKNNPERNCEHSKRSYRRMKAKDPIGFNKKHSDHRRSKRPVVLWFLGSFCVKCGQSDASVLHVDHIAGGAHKLRKAGKLNERTTANYNLIAKHPGRARRELQLLCANCNWVKRWESKELARKKTPNLFEAKVIDSKRDHARKIRSRLLAAMGNACADCGFSDFRALHVHHRNGDGNVERKEIGQNRPERFLRMIAANKEDFFSRYELLCANCHERKTRIG